MLPVVVPASPPYPSLPPYQCPPVLTAPGPWTPGHAFPQLCLHPSKSNPPPLSATEDGTSLPAISLSLLPQICFNPHGNDFAVGCSGRILVLRGRTPSRGAGCPWYCNAHCLLVPSSPRHTCIRNPPPSLLTAPQLPCHRLSLLGTLWAFSWVIDKNAK